MRSPDARRRRINFWILAAGLLLLLLAGCGRTRTVTVPGATPEPTIVTAPAETLLVRVPPRIDTVRVPGPTVATEPRVITRYLEPRADTSRAYRLWRLDVMPSYAGAGVLRLYGRSEDATFALPVVGETFTLRSSGPDSVTATVTGTPARAPDITVSCPEERACPSGRGWRGWLVLGAVFLIGLGVGAVARRIV